MIRRRFQNRYDDFEPKGLAAVLKWRVDAWRGGLPKEPRTPTASREPGLVFVHRNATAGASMQPALTWIGHATMLIQMGGLNLLTDPVFSERASPVSIAGPRRWVAPGLPFAALPHIDAVLISHNHYDHLDEASVRALNRQSGGPPLFVVPLGLRSWMAARAIVRVVELDWWQEHALHGVDFVLAPVRHWSGRGLGDRMKTLWGGYAVLASDFQLFFAGDTAYSRDFADIRAHFAPRQEARRGGGFDVALIPIGAYEPRWFMKDQHVEPAEAVQVPLDLGAKHSICIHWGTFQLSDEALDQPPRDLAAARRARDLADDVFALMAIGETRRMARRAGSAGAPV